MAESFIRNFDAAVRRYINSHGLLHRHAPVLVALSGGADSVALLASLTASGYECMAAHCNFHLRGEESLRDMRHAEALAERLGVDLFVRDFDASGRQRLAGESIEMACRRLRYAWFEDLLDSTGAQAVAVGHHREDRVETFMLNLLRGTGLAGLTAMRPRHGSVVRPLLECSRADIERRLAEAGLTYVDDSSNASDEYRRNRLRLHVLPLIEEMFPGGIDAILRTVTNLEGQYDLYSAAAARLIGDYTDSHGVVDLRGLAKEPGAAAALFERLYPLSFTPAQTADILRAAASSGQRFTSVDGSVTACIDRGTLTLLQASAAAPVESLPVAVDLRHDITAPIHIAVSQHPVEQFNPGDDGPTVAYFDAAQALADNAHWELRHPERGDRMVPFGSRKSRLLSDIFARSGVAAHERAHQWVLTLNGEIAWLPGVRCSALCTVGPDTRRFLRLSML